MEMGREAFKNASASLPMPGVIPKSFGPSTQRDGRHGNGLDRIQGTGWFFQIERNEPVGLVNPTCTELHGPFVCEVVIRSGQACLGRCTSTIHLSRANFRTLQRGLAEAAFSGAPLSMIGHYGPADHDHT
jgi:hypothetical protein